MSDVDEDRILEELQHILRVVDRLESIVNILEEMTKMALKIFKMVQDLDLLPGIPDLKFRKDEK